ncbi:hypothetical protein FSST1_012708 [Fusarium sambucinum]
MDLQVVKNHARRVILETCLLDNCRVFPDKRVLYWPSFASAVEKIVTIDHLQAIEVRFCDYCCRMGTVKFGPEELTTLEAPLNAIYKAVKKREERMLRHKMAQISPIRELKLKNFLDPYPPKALESLLKGIQRLHIELLDENQKAPTDFRTWYKSSFEHTLEHTILVPAMNQLVELTLSSHFDWGSLPSQFRGKDLVFPNLKTLRLSHFVIGHNDQFDWILNQKTLTCLRLHRCAIITHLYFSDNMMYAWEAWEVDTSDWERRNTQRDEHHPLAGIHTYTFDLRWKTLFNNIREGLPKLIKFGLILPLSKEGLLDDVDAAATIRDDTNWFMLQAYTYSDMTYCEWPFPRGWFGRGCYTNLSQLEGGGDNGDAAQAIDAAHEADVQALNDLIQATFERRGD